MVQNVTELRYEDRKRSDEYYLLKYRDELLYEKDPLSDRHKKIKRNHHFHYDLSEYELLEMMLKIDTQLKDAYELYHQYVRFNDTDYTNTIDTINDLNEIINDLQKNFVDVAKYYYKKTKKEFFKVYGRNA